MKKIYYNLNTFLFLFKFFYVIKEKINNNILLTIFIVYLIFFSFFFKYQNNLTDRKLWLRITNMMEALNYTPSNLIETNDLVKDHNTEGSEEQC